MSLQNTNPNETPDDSKDPAPASNHQNPNKNEFLTEDSILDQETAHVLEVMHDTPDVTPFKLKNMIVESVQFTLNVINRDRGKSAKVRVPNSLRPSQIAMCILDREPVLCIQCGGVNTNSEQDLLGIYASSGEKAGTYITDEKYLRNIIREYNNNINAQDVKDVIQRIKDKAKRVRRTEDPDLCPVNNGIINYKTKELMPFDPKYVFLAKSKVNYNPNAVMPVYQNPDGSTWDPESWMRELSDDPAIVNLLWQVCGAIIRPFNNWGKAIWMYSNQGNNGKGTLCALFRNLSGEGTYASLTLDAFGQDFQLEPLLNSTSIITDENDVGGYIDRAANLKAVITNDVIQINRKHKVPVSFQFKGIMVQCINDYPRIRDTSDSFYRRQIFIPFEKCFTGREKKYIKDDYLKRTEVLEYVLWRVVNMPDYTEFDEPAACKLALAEYKEYNNPVEQFLGEILEVAQWDVLPFKFLYDIYKSWYTDTMPSGKPQGRNNFIKDVQAIIQAGHFPEWVHVNQPIHPGHRMDAPEPLIIQYNVKDWANNGYDKTDPLNYCRTPLKTSYKGIVRFGSITDGEQRNGIVTNDTTNMYTSGANDDVGTTNKS